jgi:Zn/Cd-binding protein ZinT
VDEIVEGLSPLMTADTEVWANDEHIVGRSGADELDRALFELVDDYHRDIEHIVIDPPLVSFAWRMRSVKRNFQESGCTIMEINEAGLRPHSWMYFDPEPFKAIGMQV